MVQRPDHIEIQFNMILEWIDIDIDWYWYRLHPPWWKYWLHTPWWNEYKTKKFQFHLQKALQKTKAKGWIETIPL